MKKRILGQSALEYMLIMAGVASVTLIGFKSYLPKVTETSGIYFNRAATGIIGKPNPCGDFWCNPDTETSETCCHDCGGCTSSAAAIDGGWCGWGPCSEVCGGGVMSRACNCPAPSNGGADCDGAASAACETQDCPVTPTCEYSDWSGCLDVATHTTTVLCGGGERFRTCSCGPGLCTGPATTPCNTQACSGGRWSNWDPTCSVACGGEGTISRTCLSSTDAGYVPTNNICAAVGNTETQRCYNGPCAVDGGWCEPMWGWAGNPGACSEDCNGGIQTRRCECPVPEAGGAFCPDNGYTTEKVDIFTQRCNYLPADACTCNLPAPANSSPCAGQQDLSSVNVFIDVDLVTENACDGSTLCQYRCNNNWHEQSGACVRYACQNDGTTAGRSDWCYTFNQRQNNLSVPGQNVTAVNSCPSTAAGSATNNQLCRKDCLYGWRANASNTDCNCIRANYQILTASGCEKCCPRGGSGHTYTCN